MNKWGGDVNNEGLTMPEVPLLSRLMWPSPADGAVQAARKCWRFGEMQEGIMSASRVRPFMVSREDFGGLLSAAATLAACFRSDA